MNSPDFQKAEENNDKDRSVSTSSFYKQGTRPKFQPRHQSHLAHTIELQERETHEQIDKLRLALDIKTQYMSKRSADSLQESKKTMQQLVQAEKHLQESLKNIHKSDRTREWATEMEKTIQGIMQSNRDIQERVIQKNAAQCREVGLRCDSIQDKLRSEKKQRERDWEAVIDNIGNSILETEALIQSEREAMEDRMLELEKQVLDIEQQSVSLLNTQSENRRQEHEYLSKLIERIMDKLIF